MGNKKLFIGSLFLFLLACGNKQYNVEELNAYVQNIDNGLLNKQERKGYHFTLYNRPTDLWVAQELRKETPTDSLLDLFRNKYDDYLYFILKISKEKKDALYASDGYGKFSELLQNLSFRMGDFVEMVTSEQDTVPLADAHYSRLYGMSEATSVMLAFNRERLQESDWVQVNMKDLGLNVGRTNYRFKSKDLLKAPSIDFKNLNFNN